MSKMMAQWLQKAKPGDKGLTRPPASARVSAHKNEVRSIARGYFQNQFRVPAYKHVGRPTQDSQKRDEALDKVTNVFMEQYTLPTDTNELPNLPTRSDVETWWLTNDETITWFASHYKRRSQICKVNQPKTRTDHERCSHWSTA